MQIILVAGAGKSSAFLIDYLLAHARQRWKVIVMDVNAEQIAEKLNGHLRGEAAIIDIYDEEARHSLVQQADIVLSLMPPDLHYLLAEDCLRFKKNLITSSYVSPEIRSLDAAAREAGILMMCEMGLDPGIDHMSANALIHGIQRIAGNIYSFKSYCGGLIAPESDDNPWHYKISWNPRNILLAGKGGAVWLENGKQQELPYEQLYTGTKKIKVEGLGPLGYYPNRDSLKYLQLYELDSIKTFMRATLRYPAFIKGWEVIVRAGLTQETDEYLVEHNETYAAWISKKTGLPNNEGLKQHFQKLWNVEGKEMKLLEWLGLFDQKKINGKGRMSSAEILQSLLEDRWRMRPTDKDMVVMQHHIEYERKGIVIKLRSCLLTIGENRQHSAMAKTVGLPMGILAKKILLNELKMTNKLYGVHIPVMPEVYVPVLKELKKYGIEFIETIE